MSIQSVAETAGVSVATVSRVFNFPDKVTPATREHVERVAGELGYLPNSSARTLRTQRSRVLGVVLPTLLKLEQEGAIASEWGTSENNRRARFYRLTAAGRRQLRTATRDWEQTAALIGRFFQVKPQDLR